MSKHTPAPWYIHDDHEDIVTDSCGLRIACIIGDEKAQRAIDARLISAAPDLLEAIQGLLNALPSATTHPAIKAARAAIAKATGEK
jgi:hypothetical protein